MHLINYIVAKSILITVPWLIMMISSKSYAEAKHWPDFSCHPHQKNAQQHNWFLGNKMAWNSCQESHQSYKQECDKMCALRNGRVIIKTTKEGSSWRFYTDAFITAMLKELGFGGKHRWGAPQELVKNVTQALDVCKTKHREFENMTNIRYLPCEPYNPLFKCIEDAVGCNKNEPVQ